MFLPAKSFRSIFERILFDPNIKCKQKKASITLENVILDWMTQNGFVTTVVRVAARNDGFIT